MISSRKDERVAASKILPQPKPAKFTGDREQLIRAVHDALYASKIVSYAQGMELLGAASTTYKWNLNFGDIATIWRGGCIIRAKFLNRIADAYARDPALHNLLFDSYFIAVGSGDLRSPAAPPPDRQTGYHRSVASFRTQ